MKISDLSASLKLHASFPRTSTSPSQDDFSLHPDRPSVPASTEEPDRLPSRNLADTLSAFTLDSADKTAGGSTTLEAEFSKWASLSPTERIRALILDGKGLSEDALRALPTADQETVEKEILEAIKHSSGLNTQNSSQARKAELLKMF